MTLARRIRSRLPARARSSAPAAPHAPALDDRAVAELVERMRPLTMVFEPTLADLVARVDEVVDRGVPGDLVECGVWRGGSAFLMAEVLNQRRARGRKVWLFDSFEGLPPPREIDGPGANAYAENTDDPMYLDNCRADLAEVRANAERLGLTDRTEIVPGWFEDTLPAVRERVGPIALLRLDCDWYDPVKLCLDTFYDQVSRGGIVILDDYYVWDGCAIAVHEFLGRRALAHRIQAAPGVAWFRKD